MWEVEINLINLIHLSQIHNLNLKNINNNKTTVQNNNYDITLSLINKNCIKVTITWKQINKTFVNPLTLTRFIDPNVVKAAIFIKHDYKNYKNNLLFIYK